MLSCNSNRSHRFRGKENPLKLPLTWAGKIHIIPLLLAENSEKSEFSEKTLEFLVKFSDCFGYSGCITSTWCFRLPFRLTSDLVVYSQHGVTPLIGSGITVMQVHFSSVAVVFAALLLVAGSVGCRSNGGDWYNPKSYAWTNPFSRDDQVAPRSSENLAKTRPSFSDQPNVSTPPGGYSDGSSGIASRSTSPAGIQNDSSTNPWGQQSPMASQTPPSHLTGSPLTGYTTVADPSHYPPPYMTEVQNLGSQQSVAIAPQQSIPYQNQFPQQVPQEMGYQQNPISYGSNDQVYVQQTGLHQPINPNTYQYPANQVPVGVYGSGFQGNMEYQGDQSSVGTTAYQNNPYAAIHQQPVTVQPAGNSYNQPMQAPQQGQPGFQGDGMPAAPYQPYQPPASGYSYY